MTTTVFLPKLRATANSNGRYVSFSDGKRQIRAALKKAGIEAIGTFRPRKTNRSQFSLSVTGGSIIADRKVGADAPATTGEPALWRYVIYDDEDLIVETDFYSKRREDTLAYACSVIAKLEEETQQRGQS